MNGNSATPQISNPQPAGTQGLELRDIHLPEPVSWWPPAPGWWILLAVILILIAAVITARKIHGRRQLARDINNELAKIRQQFSETHNKLQLAKSLSVLLRRASISYYPEADIAGLTGDDWLRYLDESCNGTTGGRFQSDIGRILLTAPYLPDSSQHAGTTDFDAARLIALCESWLRASHGKPLSFSAIREPLRGQAQ